MLLTLTRYRCGGLIYNHRLSSFIFRLSVKAHDDSPGILGIYNRRSLSKWHRDAGLGPKLSTMSIPLSFVENFDHASDRILNFVGASFKPAFAAEPLPISVFTYQNINMQL